MQVKQDNVDFIQAERALKRAINRLNVTQTYTNFSIENPQSPLDSGGFCRRNRPYYYLSFVMHSFNNIHFNINLFNRIPTNRINRS